MRVRVLVVVVLALGFVERGAPGLPVSADQGNSPIVVSFRVTPDGQSHAYTWHRALSSLYIADGLA